MNKYNQLLIFIVILSAHQTVIAKTMTSSADYCEQFHSIARTGSLHVDGELKHSWVIARAREFNNVYTLLLQTVIPPIMYLRYQGQCSQNQVKLDLVSYTPAPNIPKVTELVGHLNSVVLNLTGRGEEQQQAQVTLYPVSQS